MAVSAISEKKVSVSSAVDGSRTKEPQALRNGPGGMLKNRLFEHAFLEHGQPGVLHPLTTSTSGPRKISVDDILNNQREAVIIHNGEEYLLRLTSKNKLILTK